MTTAKKLLLIFEYSEKALKPLVELPIFSKLDYCNNLFVDLPQYYIRRMVDFKDVAPAS